MKKTIISFALLAINQTMGSEHSLGAHEHGSIKVGMAIEKNMVEIEIDGPAESFLGFEYLPNTAKEKNLFNNLKVRWIKNLELFIAFDKKLHCKTTEASFEQVLDDEKENKSNDKKMKGTHSDLEAKAKLTCSGKLNGTEVRISLKKNFPNIKKLFVEIIGTETKSIEITKAVQILKI